MMSPPPLAERTHDLAQSDIRAITRLVNAVDGINLGQGICDLPTPEPIKKAARQAIADDRSVYSHYAGIRPLRTAILEKARSYNGLPATSIDEVMVGLGATGTFVTAVHALLDPGDEVVLFEPFYGYHRNILKTVGASIQYVPPLAGSSRPDLDRLASVVTDRTKLVVVNTPSNPGGIVWSREELERMLHLMQEHDCYAVTDEIYEYMVYEDHEHFSLGALPGAYERTITISGFSKTYNMTGWRLGYAVGPQPLIERMGLLNDQFYICAPTPLQYGVAAAFSMDDSYFDDLQEAYAERRQLLCETLEKVGFHVPRPEGAYYVFADFSTLAQSRDGFEDAQAACETLIREAGVGTIPGPSFFEDPRDGRYLLRFCFAKEMPVLEQACRQLRDALVT